MPNINKQISGLAVNIHQLQNSRSVLGIDDQGGLIRVNFKGQVARTLLYLGIGREGKWGHRLVLYLAGKDKFDLFCQSHQTRYANSMRNISQVTKRLETRKLDRDLTELVNNRIDEVLHTENTYLTVADFITLHTRIRNEIKTHKEAIARRSAHHASLWKKIDAKEEIPAMGNATYRGVRIAIAALEKNLEKTINTSLLEKMNEVDERDKTDEMLNFRLPVNIAFAEQTCGKRFDAHMLQRDVEDANNVLAELKLAELHIRRKVQSDIKKLKSEYKALLSKIAREGAHTSPEQVADWELKLHRLKTKIKYDEQHIEDHIKMQVDKLKQNLLTTLKESFDDKLVLSKLTVAETEMATKAIASKPASGLKSAIKHTTTQDQTTTPDTKVSTKRRVHFGGLEIQQLEESYLLPRFVIDDDNRSEWLQNIKTALDDNEDPQAPYMIAKVLEQRGKHNIDDADTIKGISLLRTHPVFLKKNNFGALVINIRAAVDERRSSPAKFSDETKQIYRTQAENINSLAEQQLESSKDLIDKLNSYQAELDKLDNEPTKHEIKQSELNELLAEHKEDLEAYKNVYEDPDPNFAVHRKLGEEALKALPQMLSAANKLQDDAEIMMRILKGSPLFVDKRPQF